MGTMSASNKNGKATFRTDPRLLRQGRVLEEVEEFLGTAQPDGNLAQRLYAVAHAKDYYECTRKVSKFYTVVGLVAALVVIPAIAIQIVTIVKNESACDLSLYSLIGMQAVYVLWFVYALGNSVWISAFSTAGGVFLTAIIMGLKLKYDRDGHCPQKDSLF